MANISDKNYGLKVYENFQSGSSFSVAIVAEIDPIQYWRDRPLFLGKIKPLLSESISYSTSDPETMIDFLNENEQIKEYYEKITNIVESVDAFNEEAQKIGEKIIEYSYINENEDLNVDYPNSLPNYKNIIIKDKFGYIIRSKKVDIHDRSKRRSDGSYVPITILDSLPDDWSDDDSPENLDTVSVTTLPDSFIKEKLWISSDYIPNFTKELSVNTSIITTAIREFHNISEELPENTDAIIQKYNEELKEPIEIWYGIPLINLSPDGVPVEKSYILQINTKKNWSLDITNIVGSGLDSFELNIDKQVKPGQRFTAGVNLNANQVTIFLKVEGDPVTYTSTVRLKEPLNYKLNSFGGDNEALKTLCGNVWDMHYWESPTNFNDTPSGLLPFYPDDTDIYDFNIERIRDSSNYRSSQNQDFKGIGSVGNNLNPYGNYGSYNNSLFNNSSNGLNNSSDIDGGWVYSTKSDKSPAFNNGGWIQLTNQWKFALNGYMDRFYCQRNFINSSFTILWYSYQYYYPGGLRTLFSDNINNNYIQYNYDTNEIIISFNGIIYLEKIILPEKLWYQIFMRYNADDLTLTFGFIDFFHNRLESVIVNIGPGLEFELMSLWARFDKEQGRFVEIQQGISGMLMIKQDVITNNDLYKLFYNHKIFIKDLPI